MEKAVRTSYLRNLSGSEGVRMHTDVETAEKRRELIRDEQRYVTEKARARRHSTDGDEDALSDQMRMIDRDLKPETRSSDVEISYLFTHFKICLTVCPPTRRRFDPPNLYPTLKALIDGLTDASWWADDDFRNLLEVSFRYGGLSGRKGIFTLILDVQEVDDEEFKKEGYTVESECHLI